MLLSLGLSHHNLVKRRNLERVSDRSSKFLLFSSIGDQIIRDNAKVAYQPVHIPTFSPIIDWIRRMWKLGHVYMNLIHLNLNGGWIHTQCVLDQIPGFLTVL